MTIIPRMLPVESSSVNAVGYDGGQLFIRYTSGATYAYKDVPAETFIKLVNAKSIGHFVATVIKQFDYTCIE